MKTFIWTILVMLSGISMSLPTFAMGSRPPNVEQFEGLFQLVDGKALGRAGSRIYFLCPDQLFVRTIESHTVDLSPLPSIEKIGKGQQQDLRYIEPHNYFFFSAYSIASQHKNALTYREVLIDNPESDPLFGGMDDDRRTVFFYRVVRRDTTLTIGMEHTESDSGPVVRSVCQYQSF